MKTVKKLKKKIAKISSSSDRDKMTVVLERVEDQIKLVAEGQVSLRESMDRRFDEVDEKFEAIDMRFIGVDRRFDGIDEKFEAIDEKFKNIDEKFEGVDNNFQSVFGYLSRIEDEIGEIREDLKNNYERKGWDVDWRKMMENRLERIEAVLIGRKTTKNQA